MKYENTPKLFIIYCTLAGFISAATISGLLTLVDIVSGTPTGTFFAVIGISLGISDPSLAQYIGLGLHILTGTAAGNIFGQFALFWHKLIPYNIKHGVFLGSILGVSLWTVLFLPLATFSIHPMINSFLVSAPNQYVTNIALSFQGLYPLIAGGSLLFHLAYGAIFGVLSGRMTELKLFSKDIVETNLLK